MLTIAKELSIADIRSDSYVNIAVYSGYGLCASSSVALQQCREYLSQNLLVSKDFEPFAWGKFPPPHPSIFWARVVFEVLLCNYRSKFFSILCWNSLIEKYIGVWGQQFSGHASGVFNSVLISLNT